MAEGQENGKPDPSPSVERDQIPLFELVAKFRLPFITKAATTSVSGFGEGQIVAGQLYRLHRLITIETVVAQVWNSRLSFHTEGKSVVELSLPVDYQGPFQVCIGKAVQ